MEKILIIQTAFIGDAVLTLPMIQKLKDFFPGSQIDVLAVPLTAEIFNASPSVDNVIVMDKKGEHKSFFSLLKLSRQIRDKKYGRIYSPHRSFRSAFIVLQSGVRETFGFSNSSFKYAYKNIIDYRLDHHEVRRNLDLIGFQGADENWRILPNVLAGPDVIEKIACLLMENRINEKFAVVAPGSVWSTKRYPLEYYEVIISYLRSKCRVILLGGINDKDICSRLGDKFRDIVSLAGSLNLVESIELLKRAVILVSNDSAPAHLGMCVDIPVLSIYCSTVDDFGFYPYNGKSRYLSYDDLPCKPCGIHGFDRCPIGTFACGYRLKPESVISKIEEMLEL
ncbi:MAG TPA: glycosyltransferase family 9 protein [Ignavibacteriaceae bacterium]|nr:glycosyltransferase family 9 protein [Ignavibacteriaceae bacterium]